MTHLLRTLALCFGLALAAPAMAQDGPTTAATAKKSIAALQTYLDRVEKAGKRPDYTSKPASELLRAVFDTGRLAALPPFKPDDLEWLTTWGEAANYAIMRIMWFGVQTKPQFDELAFRRNVTDYEDQYATATNFLIRFAARQSGAMTQAFNEMPPAQRTAIRLEGYELSQKGAGEMIRGTLISVAQGMKLDNARMMTAALRETREAWSGFLPAEQRKEALRIIELAVAYFRDDVVNDNIASFAAAISTAI
jgi:hypothetical protein